MEQTAPEFIDLRLTRLAERRSNDAGIEVAAAQIGDTAPFYFVAHELLVGADETALLASLRAQGATIVAPPPVPPQPIEIARTRRPRNVEFPRPFKVRMKAVWMSPHNVESSSMVGSDLPAFTVQPPGDRAPWRPRRLSWNHSALEHLVRDRRRHLVQEGGAGRRIVMRLPMSDSSVCQR